MSASTLAELTYEQAQKALEQQERQVNELRQRTGTLLGAAALTASFFGAAALGRDGVGIPARSACTCASRSDFATRGNRTEGAWISSCAVLRSLLSHL